MYKTNCFHLVQFGIFYTALLNLILNPCSKMAGNASQAVEGGIMGTKMLKC